MLRLCHCKSIVIDINNNDLSWRVKLCGHKYCNSDWTTTNNCDDVTWLNASVDDTNFETRGQYVA